LRTKIEIIFGSPNLSRKQSQLKAIRKFQGKIRMAGQAQAGTGECATKTSDIKKKRKRKKE
jgi:hypothetical protein